MADYKSKHDPEGVSRRNPFALYCDDPSLTQQSFAKDADVNVIIDRFTQGKDISAAVTERVAQYGDFSSIPDYQEALNLVNRANGMFMDLDADVRQRFGNDPVRMVAFLQDGRNYDEAVKLGLCVPREAKSVDVGELGTKSKASASNVVKEPKATSDAGSVDPGQAEARSAQRKGYCD